MQFANPIAYRYTPKLVMFRYQLIRFVMNVIRTLFLANIKVTGLENVPEKGPCVVTTNHMSTVDTPILLMAFPIQEWSFFAGEKWRNHLVFGPIMGWLGAIYINRENVDRKSLRMAQEALMGGAIFGLAPEGARSKDGKLEKAKGGAAYLAHRANAPILPVGIVNSDVLFQNFKRLRRTKIEVHIGVSYDLPDLGRRAKGEDLEALTHLIMAKIAAQLPERYHGAYQKSPALKAIKQGEDPWPYCHE